ncbi:MULTISPECIES: hypothetical protein [Duncaniella]|jgi:hypothetical protein|uniref:hypothetical protein n=1 Tax=Duncaniella TaxID=2518495 RepID=UPI000F538BC4|nr:MULTISPECIES: hypothetical protein [Duncaniella]NBI21083.1 hypothetical protein [Muribaculaceae bacterium Z1]QCD40004.1 hypothetical protein E7745_10925 [Duncaniella sp. C9]QCP73652.1 hypothetical protein FDZ78_14395 [Duncaniella sp. B8]
MKYGVMILSSETTGPNSDRFNRYLRSFLWIDDIILVIDDLASHEEGSYQWLWHPIGTTVKKGVDLDIRNGKAHVVLRQLYPETLAPSDFIHDYPSNMTWEIHNAPGEDNKGDQPYYSFHLPKRHDRVKGGTALILDPESQPEIERRKGDGWIGVRIKSHGKITDVYINQLADGRIMHMNSWINPDGWNTDAYITALTYSDDKQALQHRPSRHIIIYGSRLRHGNSDPLYSELKKNNKIW